MPEYTTTLIRLHVNNLQAEGLLFPDKTGWLLQRQLSNRKLGGKTLFVFFLSKFIVNDGERTDYLKNYKLRNLQIVK